MNDGAGTLSEDGFVSADVFFTGSAIEAEASKAAESLKRESLMQLSGIRNKISAWETTEIAPIGGMQKRAVEQKQLAAVQEGVDGELIGAVMPAAEKYASDKEISPIPSILFAAKYGEQHSVERSQPLPGPKGQEALAAALASEASKVVAAVRNTRKSLSASAAAATASSSETCMPGAPLDLMALKNAVQALKISQVPSSINLPKPAIAEKPALGVFHAGPIEAPEQAGYTASVSAAGASSPSGTATTPTAQNSKLDKTPGPPANTPASPLLQAAAISPASARSMPVEAAKVAHAIQSIPMEDTQEAYQGHTTPVAAQASAAKMGRRTPGTAGGQVPAPSPAYTEYDGDDVVMGDATPEPAGGSMVKSSKATSTAPRSTRFRAEALRLGVTPTASRVLVTPKPEVVHENNFESTAIPTESNAEVAESDLAPQSAQQSSAPAVAAPRAPTPAAAPVHEARQQTPAMSTHSSSHSAPRRLDDSPTMSDNPLAQRIAHAVMDTPGATHSPTASGATSGSLSNNPLFAGTPSHPTPQSVTMLRPAGLESSVRTPSTTGSSAASEGIRLAEKLHQAAEKLSTPAASGGSGDETFQFKDDVAALLQALESRTPLSAANKPSASNMLTPAGAGPATGAAGRALAAASTEERPKAQARRRSSLSNGSPTILDLNGFDADGERKAPGMATPLALAGPARPAAAILPTAAISKTPLMPNNASTADVSALKQRIADLEEDRKEASSLLASYQGSIAELQDRHSATVVRLQAEAAVYKGEMERLRSERADIHSQFESLFKDKYQPLKTEAAALRRGADALRARLAQEESKGTRVAQLEQELAAAHQATQAAQQTAAAAQAEAAAAREAERLAEQRAEAAVAAAQGAEKHWASKFKAEAQRAEQALADKDAEVASWREKHAALARQHDDVVHRAHVSQAAKERKGAEVARKEEEICALEVRLREVESVLGEYKAENEKFFGVKERYKAAVAALEREVAAKDEEKARLAAMCNDLLCQLEKEAGEKK